MKKILIIGMNPHTIDFTNPELPQGLSIEKVEQGTNATLEKLISMGYNAELFLFETGATDLSNLAKQLNEKDYDGIVIGKKNKFLHKYCIVLKFENDNSLLFLE